MKKADAIESVERAGHTIHDLYARAWSTALYPTEHGWGPAIASIGAIPLLSMASIGQKVGKAVVEQLPAEVFEKIPGGRSDKGP
jgi:hypothetical protein